MDWFLRLRERSRTAADERDFALWLGQSNAHRDAWERACRTWELMGEVTPVHQERWRPAGHAMALAARRRQRVWSFSAAVCLAAACLALVLAGPSLLLQYRADFTTTTAELRKVTLDDGSMVELSAASAIDIDFTDGRREVTLLAGEAFFDVAHEADRPFVVNAGTAKVTVLGTAFDVQVKPEEIKVELARGVVSLGVDGASTIFELSAGDTVTIENDGGTVARSRLAPEDMAAWRSGRLFVNDVTIASVVAELQRYHPAWISIPSGDLASRRVTGLYDLSDPDRALEALVQPYGGKVHHLSPYLRVLALF